MVQIAMLIAGIEPAVRQRSLVTAPESSDNPPPTMPNGSPDWSETVVRKKRLNTMNRSSRRRVWVPLLSLSFLAALVGPTGAQPATSTTENDAITFGAATWVDLQRVTGADPLVDVDSRGNGRVFVNFPWGRVTTPTLPNIVARSLDGGDTFRTLFDEACATSNSQPHCGDPGMGNSALALSPDSNNVYLSGIVPGFAAISASASADAGDTWPNFNPVTTPGIMDRPWLLAPGGQKAYLAWNNVALRGLAPPGGAARPSVQYATTPDGGASWTVDPNPKYAAGAAIGLVMDRSRGYIYQVFTEVDHLGDPIPGVGIAVAKDHPATFQTYHVGDDLACGTCPRPDGGTDYRGWSLPWMTVDTGGNLYAVWGTGSGSDVVMSTSNISDPANDPTQGGKPGSTWSPRVRVSTGAAETAVVGNVVAGSPGNVAIAYYGTKHPSIPEEQPAHAEWYPFVAHSSNALSSSPGFTQSVIGHRANHKGGICTDGSGQCPRGKSQDRGLRNWMNVGFDPDGRLYAAWSDDNNDGKRTGIRFAKQLTGPTLMAGKPPFDDPAPSSSMTDPSGDATWPNRITGGTNLPGADLTRIAVRNNGKDIRFRLSVGNAERFQDAVEAVSADRLLFVVRFQSADQDYFAAYEYSTGGTDRAFTGRIDANDRVEPTFENAIAFLPNDPHSEEATWTVDHNTITITQKLSAFEGLVASPAASPPKLLSVVGSALIGPSQDNATRFKLLNTVDATRAFDSE